ncbi:MAG: hypothetical protein NTZ12_11055 [Candidatus Aminicenantes bacterium]|nr:hypothetical protein [Candidatus Aminicenantes bacterium]
MLKANVVEASSGNGQFLQIAAVTVAISHDLSFNLLTQDPLYNDFFTTLGTEKSASLIQARLVHGRMPDVSRLHKLFDTRESWSIYSDPRGNWIRFQSILQPDPFWIARFDRQVNRVFVYCGSPLIGTREEKTDLANPICYPLDQLLLMYHLAYRAGILAHAAGIDLDGRGLIFPGCSGAGKSTLTRLFADCQMGNLLSDERVVLRLTGTGWQVFGTPWAGTAGVGSNGCAPLTGMFFLKHDNQNLLRRITAENAMERLLPILSIPWYDADVMMHIIASTKQLTSKVPAYEMSFKPDRSAIDFLVRFQKTLS